MISVLVIVVVLALLPMALQTVVAVLVAVLVACAAAVERAGDAISKVRLGAVTFWAVLLCAAAVVAFPSALGVDCFVVLLGVVGLVGVLVVVVVLAVVVGVMHPVTRVSYVGDTVGSPALR